jgi:mono/diheme cytochrome c family protein
VKDVAPIDHQGESYTCVEVLMRFFWVVSLFAVVGCGSDSGKPTQFVVPERSSVAGPSAPAPRAPSGAAQSGGDAGVQVGDGPSSGSPGSAGSDAGLPCEVEAVLRAHCQSCHSAPPVAGAPMALLSYEDLISPARTDASRRVVDVALTRMQLGQMPPPPAAAVAADEAVLIEDWIASGAMRESCAAGAVDRDAGGPVGGAPGSGPYDTPTTCTTDEYWDDGDDDSPRMHPGGACVSCHAQNEGPNLTIGGTVYSTAHEPTDCNGVDGEDDVEVRVVITDADGQVITLQVNDVGNFYSSRPIAFPFNAKVVAGGRERRMGAAQRTGNCNGCHTERGENGAPGRIMAP